MLLGSGADSVDVSNLTTNASLSGTGDNNTVTATADADFALTDSLLTRSGGGDASGEGSGDGSGGPSALAERAMEASAGDPPGTAATAVDGSGSAPSFCRHW